MSYNQNPYGQPNPYNEGPSAEGGYGGSYGGGNYGGGYDNNGYGQVSKLPPILQQDLFVASLSSHSIR